MFKKRHTLDTALPKIIQFCSYQERAHKEVRDKLYGFGLHKADVETTISRLIEENHLNESRFAEAFVRGKFRMKQWGKVKIGHALKLRQISQYNIRKALDGIDATEYQQTLLSIAGKKRRLLEKTNVAEIALRSKLTGWLISRGYEIMLVRQTVQSLFSKEKITQSKTEAKL